LKRVEEKSVCKRGVVTENQENLSVRLKRVKVGYSKRVKNAGM
jgi:hypothetical protein